MVINELLIISCFVCVSLVGTKFRKMLKAVSIIAGPKAYSLTWRLQYVNLFMINVGYFILAGQALKVCIPI